MDFSLTEVIRTYLRHYRTRKFLRKFARVLGCIVAFVTTYALILPAITLEQESFCGFEEHTHMEACYQMQTQNRRLVCNGAVSGLHVHSGSCYNADGVVLCGQADYVVHTHNDSCRDGSGALVCTMAERAQHSHGDGCYRTPDPVPHSHKDTCAEPVKGELLCTQQEDPGHQHGTGCYQPGTELVCMKTAGHQHTDACYISPLICTLSTDPHSHDGACYTRGTLLCSIPENHVHQDACFETNITCGLSEYDHTHDSACYVSDQVCTEAHEEHTDGCWESRLSCGLMEGGHHHTDSCKTVSTVCGTQEGHTHGDGCYEKNLSCGKTEGEVHSHSSGCYGTEKQLNCGLDENHVHENTCYKQELFCAIPESEGHAHGDSCYQWVTQYICGLEEGAPETGEKELVCTEPAALVHVHGDACFEITQTDAAPVCGTEHDHTYTCYSLNCTLEEHTHTLQCYSNPDADVENVSDWENTINDLELTGDWNLDVVAVAESQLGYQESTRNYTVWEDNTLHGYTRYGAWYGVPNGDWCGMFASFCLNYGGVKGMPYNYGTRPWITDLSKPELDLYRTAEEYIPIPGDLVFFDWDTQDALSDHVGIVYEVIEATETQNAKLKTIEGNSSNRVQFVTYDLDSPVLLGYSMLPENPDVEYGCDLTKHVHNKRDCYDEQDKLICEKTVHIHSKDCITEKSDDPVYYCGLEVHVHQENCYDEAGELTCHQPEHEHTEACQTEPEPVYYCGQEVHVHEATCYDEAGELTCQQPEHEHTEACQTEPESMYYCGQEAHIHGDGCYDETGGLICEQAEHAHEDACLIEPPVYSCGQEVHIHEENCYDETGELICQQPEHEHTEACQAEPKPVYYCGQEIHIHEETCYDEAGELICEKAVHDHTEECLIRYYCGKETHIHDAKACHDAEGNLICEKTEHTHAERCRYPPMMSTGPKFYCGLEMHIHEDTCYDIAQNLTCRLQEHTHDDSCLIKPPEYLCGAQEHTHSDACKDVAGGLICGQEEHTHSSLCLADLSALDVDARQQVEKVILMIDEIPSADEIDGKIAEFEAAEDYAGEEAWLTETYQKVGNAYAAYISLPEDMQAKVVNRDKLLKLDYIWSVMPLNTYYVWLDGTNGSMMSLAGSDNTRYVLNTPGRQPYAFTLPTAWKSPAKYSYTLRGWYDIHNKQYYQPGDTVDIYQNTVFYADWEAATYNVGQFDAHVVDTVSTNDFVTTRLFDYSGIFNMYSSRMNSSSVGQNSHSESWEVVSKGTNGSYGIILRDWDTGGPRQNSWPSNAADHNTSQDTVTFGLYNAYNMYDLFFNPGASYMGKEYLGTADHLFQYEKDPNSPYYGYYYYDSARNAASYNQSAGRFYVYDYLERTTTSKDNGKDSDFLPFNSIYVNNPEGYAPDPDSAAGGRTTYTFDSTDQNAGMAGSNFWFGMTTDIRFYLPNQPGTRDGSGYGNQSLYGQDMEFRFSGDDDVFVLVDNQLVLDIGGMHDIKSGTINFSTGIVTVEGSEQTTRTTYVRSLQPGEHTLTLLYMERGSSMSNCSIYFNISPRFTLSLQKEDFLTNAMLNGAEFQVFMDENCTIPATLWSSYQAYRQNSNQTTNTFKVANGKSTIWGFAAGNTYYIKETKPPDNQGYVVPNGLIRMELNNKGVASYTALVIPNPGAEAGADNPSPGFTVEGFRIDEENHVAYLIVSNSSQQGETTQVLVQKRWEGQQSTPVTVYLLADGQRIREIVLSDENNWQHVWENLPKFRTAGETEGDASQQTEITYTVEEATVPGYIGKVEAITQSSVTTAAWEQVEKLAAQQTYLLQSPAGCLSTDGSGKLNWISLEAAKTSDGAQWHVESRSGDYVTLKNDAGFYLAYHDSYVPSEMYFYATTQQNSVKFDDNLESYGESPRIYANDNARYLLTTIDSRGYVLADYNGWHQNSAWLTLHRKIGGETSVPITGLGYKITNRPVSAEDLTSLKVTKRWVQRDGETAFGDTSQYQELSVPIKLQSKVGAGAFADTGQTAMLNFRSGWTHTFSNLPKKDAKGNEIAYTVVEDWQSEYWQPQYSAVTKNPDGSFAVEVKNVYSYRADIPVEKHWDPFIHDTEKVPVQIHLYSAVEDDMQATWLETITVSQENQWKCVFEVIPPEEAGVNYYIYEPTGQFIPYYSNPARIFIGDESRRVSRVTFDMGTGTAETTLVTNRPVVELPKTGGFGTDGLMAGGLLLAAAAWILLRAKRGKEWLHTL